MALAYTNLDLEGNPSTYTSSFTTVSLSPPANSVLVVTAAGAAGLLITGLTIADTFGDTGGTSWSAVGFEGGAQYYLTANCWYRAIGSGPSAGTITVTCVPGTANMEFGIVVDQITGAATSGTVPSGQKTNAEVDYSTSGSVSLGGTPVSTSMVYSVATYAPTTPTPSATGFTAGAAIATTGFTASSYLIGGGSETVNWTNLNAGNVNYLFALEILVSGGVNITEQGVPAQALAGSGQPGAYSINPYSITPTIQL